MTHNPPSVAGMTWGWGAIFGLLNLLLGGGAFATWLKNRPAMQLNRQTAEEKLRDDLIERVGKLEQDAKVERAQHEAVVSLMRHRLNNSEQCLDLLMALLEQADELPERVRKAITLTKELRQKHKDAEALERSTMQAAVLAARAGPVTAVTPPADPA